jgi:hypothetical protein
MAREMCFLQIKKATGDRRLLLLLLLLLLARGPPPSHINPVDPWIAA